MVKERKIPVKKERAESEGSSPSDTTKLIKKRKYSRGGCQECKRRKMKCDESKPFCHNCSRLNKTCIYEVKSKFKFELVGQNSQSPEHDISEEHKELDSTTNSKLSTIKSPEFEGVINNNNIEKGSTNQLDNFSVNFYKPSNRYDNNFQSEVESPILPIPQSSKHYSPAVSPSVIPLMSFPSIRPDTYSSSPSISQNISNSRPSFKNAISDILTPNDMPLPKSETIESDSPNQKDMQNLFDEASLLVSDINHLVSIDLALENHNLFSSLESSSLKKHFNANNTDKLSHSRSGDKLDNSASASHKSTGSISGSDTFENHNFQIDDFTDRISHTVDHNNLPNPTIGNNTDGMYEQLRLSNSELIAETMKENNLVGPHITYLKTLTTTDLSYHLYPFASSIESNEVVKLLLTYLKNCPYLLTSLLAISATFQYNQTGKKVHDLTRQKYISVCLRSLSDAFANNGGGKNAYNLADDIERLLLTVLVLTSNFTATAFTHKDSLLSSWKTHLRGAKDLLVNYSKITKNSKIINKNINENSMSGGLALAKIWFFAIESLAGLTSPLGGTLAKQRQKPKIKNKQDQSILTTDTEDESSDYNKRIFLDTGYFNADNNKDYHDALVRAGIQTSYPNHKSYDFNMFVGSCMSYVYVMQEFIGALDSLRANDYKQLSTNRIAKLIASLHTARQSFVAPNVSATYIIPQTSPAHPNYINSYDRIILPEAGYAKSKDSDGNELYYSWFDLSHQVHVDYIYLRVLITPGLLKMPYDHALVQELVTKIMGCAFFIRPKTESSYNQSNKDNILAETENYYLPKELFDNRCIMIQSPFRTCATLVTKDEDFEKIELFFLGLVKLGNGSSLAALDIVTRFRERARLRRENIDTSEHEPHTDTGTETEFIPFA